jgi:site-specific DNA recombinase
MKTPVPKPLRCAIYTRKSTEHNLELAFNSLDAQREACEAYVKSRPMRAGVCCQTAMMMAGSQAPRSSARPCSSCWPKCERAGWRSSSSTRSIASPARKAVRRKVKRSSLPSSLSGLLFDDRGNRMSPSHANKKGVRYRYYVSQALLQNRKAEAGSIARVSAPDLEELVAAAVHHHSAKASIGDEGCNAGDVSGSDLVARHVRRILLKPKHMEIELCHRSSDVAIDGSDRRAVGEDGAQSGSAAPKMIEVPWAPSLMRVRKGIAWKPSDQQSGLDPANRHTLLTAIAWARLWLDDLSKGRVTSFADIARRENKVERHIRLILLACLSPRLIDAIANGNAPAHLTVTLLTSALPHNWAEQENKFGMI